MSQTAQPANHHQPKETQPWDLTNTCQQRRRSAVASGAPPEDRLKYAEVIDLVNASSIADADHPYITIDVTVAYWRKANAIHNWFVQECNEGNDDGNAFHVSREQLEALYQLCYTVPKGLAIHGDEYADEHLPTTSGFFF